MDLKAIGSNIRAARAALRLTQEDLAARASIAHRVLQRIEAGSANPTLETLDALANALGSTVSELLPDTSDPHVDATLTDAVSTTSSFLSAFLSAAPARRLAALYLLTTDEAYLSELARLPGATPIAQALKKLS